MSVTVQDGYMQWNGQIYVSPEAGVTHLQTLTNKVISNPIL